MDRLQDVAGLTARNLNGVVGVGFIFEAFDSISHLLWLIRESIGSRDLFFMVMRYQTRACEAASPMRTKCLQKWPSKRCIQEQMLKKQGSILGFIPNDSKPITPKEK